MRHNYWKRDHKIPASLPTESEKEESVKKWADHVVCKFCGYRSPFCGRIPDQKCLNDQ